MEAVEKQKLLHQIVMSIYEWDYLAVKCLQLIAGNVHDEEETLVAEIKLNKINMTAGRTYVALTGFLAPFSVL